MKIAFQTFPGEGWQAGVTYTVSLMQGLRALGDEAPELALVIWEGTPEDWYRSSLPYAQRKITAPAAPPSVELLHLASLRRHAAWWIANRLRRAARPVNHHFRSDALQQAGMDCTFSLPMERRTDFGVPLVVWLPDLQHHHLPDLFAPEERARRDQQYRREVEAASLVLVTAEAVRQDLQAFAPVLAGKARVLPLVVPLPTDLYDHDPGQVAVAYHLPEKFFWLPNQFWQHKNHGLVLEALRLLGERGVRPCVACAGVPADHRAPAYFSELLQRVSRWNLREQFIFLGALPHGDVLGLMRQTICLLNPSLFEGFGFSVAESKLVGKRALLSDLPVHREQAAPGAVYFDPRDARDLADKMEMIWQTTQPGPDLEREAAARADYPRQQQAFGRAVLDIAREAVASPAEGGAYG